MKMTCYYLFKVPAYREQHFDVYIVWQCSQVLNAVYDTIKWQVIFRRVCTYTQTYQTDILCSCCTAVYCSEHKVYIVTIVSIVEIMYSTSTYLVSCICICIINMNSTFRDKLSCDIALFFTITLYCIYSLWLCFMELQMILSWPSSIDHT